jgi:hypothetical protein
LKPVEAEAKAVDVSQRTARRAKRGGRQDTILTTPAGVETGNMYQGQTLLGG